MSICPTKATEINQRQLLTFQVSNTAVCLLKEVLYYVSILIIFQSFKIKSFQDWYRDIRRLHQTMSILGNEYTFSIWMEIIPFDKTLTLVKQAALEMV